MANENLISEPTRQCPYHGLSLANEFECIVCQLEKLGKTPNEYRVYPLGLSTVSPTTKMCTGCGVQKPLTEFLKRQCKECCIRKNKENYAKHKERKKKEKEKTIDETKEE